LLESLEGGPTGLGFVSPNVPDDGEDPQGWCSGCEAVLDAEGGWNDRSEAHADIKLVCERCFERIAELNRT
jgi:hypothetical protein